MSDENDKNFKRISFYVSNQKFKAIEDYAKSKGIKPARALGILVDNAFTNLENPFDFIHELPDVSRNIDYAYAHESGKILNFMEQYGGSADLEMFTILRHEMKIPDREVFLTAFAECIKAGLVEACIKYDKSMRCEITAYRIASEKSKNARKRREYESYKKLKKKFEGKEKPV